MSAADRFFGRLEPLAYDDDGTLENLAAALMAPVEVVEISRDTDTLTAWESLFDPDTCPAGLLDWLAVYNGVILGPAVLTEAEKRYRIKQAAGRYRGTPRATVEEVQLLLSDTKTVYIAFHTSDEWHYTVGVLTSEMTVDQLIVEAAILTQKPAGMSFNLLVLDPGDWTWFVLAPTLIAERDGDDEYTISTPDYPTWTSVTAAFTDWADLVAGP